MYLVLILFIFLGCEASVRELASVIKPVDPNSSSNRSDLLERRNAVKMHAYLLCQFIEVIENDSVAEASAAAIIKVINLIVFTIIIGLWICILRSYYITLPPIHIVSQKYLRYASIIIEFIFFVVVGIVLFVIIYWLNKFTNLVNLESIRLWVLICCEKLLLIIAFRLLANNTFEVLLTSSLVLNAMIQYFSGWEIKSSFQTL